MHFKKYIESFFVMSKSERNGSILLLLIVFLLILFRFLIPLLSPDPISFEVDYDQRISKLEKIKDSLNQNLHTNQVVKSNRTFKEVKNKKNTETEGKFTNSAVSLFRYNPNVVSFEEMIRLGFNTYAAQNLISYREKGGVFRKSEDLKKIYGIDSAFFVKIHPFTIIPVEEGYKKTLIEINGADSAELTTLSGIGPVYAARICKYRRYLGGFVSLDQLKEVYQLPEETYLTIREFFTLDEKRVEKINVNFSDIKELKKHPYCSYEDARKIIDYRSKKGYINSIEQLLLDSIIELSVFNRLSPYLKVQ